MFTLIAHRGYSDLAPENTLAAFDLAVERGFPHIELDVQLTRDGVPVIIHDPLLDRTTNGSGHVRDHTFAEVRALSAGTWFQPRDGGPAGFEAERVPTLAEVLDRYHGRTHLHIELKSDEQELVEIIARMILDSGWESPAEPFGIPGATITSFHVEQLHRSRLLLPRFRHGWLLPRITEADLNLATTLDLEAICPRADTLTLEAVEAASRAGLTVRAWGVQDEGGLLTACHTGAAGATVSWPERAANALRDAGLD